MRQRPDVTMCYVCPKCSKVVQQQTFQNQTYIEIKKYVCIKCNVEMTHHLVIPQGHKPLDPTPVYLTKRYRGEKTIDDFEQQEKRP